MKQCEKVEVHLFTLQLGSGDVYHKENLNSYKNIWHNRVCEKRLKVVMPKAFGFEGNYCVVNAH
ncbi:CLUMA_CG016029, isoform A [Clunio marinus]|uniref:CLUMA_CG016029, isoform A n=1 Tax=Clunio marinus TaxID=568069 RepID=A0A1J1IRS2_9DIPT|nr:CLUMA_CG016029, isoform A [Clunio marinus]